MEYKLEQEENLALVDLINMSQKDVQNKRTISSEDFRLKLQEKKDRLIEKGE